MENTIRSPYWGHPPADLSAAIETAAEALVIVWERAQESMRQPVSTSQLRALLAVERFGEINLNGLAEELGSIPSSASRLCDRLQAAGLISRSTGRTDRREVVLSLTPDGHALLAAMRRARRAEIAAVLAAMPYVEQQALLDALEQFRAAATAGGDGVAAAPAAPTDQQPADPGKPAHDRPARIDRQPAEQPPPDLDRPAPDRPASDRPAVTDRP